MGDDGAGIAVLEALRSLALPQTVRLVDGGTDASTLARLWDGEPLVVLVDALARGYDPGTLTVLDRLALRELAVNQPHVHALALPACVEWVFLAEPRLGEATVVLVGIEPATVAPTHALSPAVAAAIPQAVRTVLGLLGLPNQAGQEPPRPTKTQDKRSSSEPA
mgnify:CR=1 FL=1